MKIAGLASYHITLTDFTIAFVPFGILLSLALMAPETTLDFGLYRTIYTIWVTTVLVTPALCAFTLPGNSEHTRNLWLLFWTFSFFAYIVHMLYAVFSVYQGSFQEFLAGQGVFPAIVNVVFTLWWTLDVFLAWFYRSDVRWVQIERVAAHVFIGLTFFASTVFLKHGFINVLGILMTVSVLVCLVIRLEAQRRRTMPISNQAAANRIAT